ncbi:MAG: YfhO family protein [Lachnospiraceae bacterium]|nr:YfhO family protein [Lachnospiraceae bacterium]
MGMGKRLECKRMFHVKHLQIFSCFNLDRMILFLTAVILAAVFFFTQENGLWASDVDWISQHSVFPDYFRKLFYETGELYPDFAFQIGGGQNIFNFAYYGFLNPCILLSYLFPWIPMDLWIMGLSLVLYMTSVLLFHFWISSRGLERRICFYVSVMFMLAAPLFYHSCVQIMFVNYMPFLCLGLIGTDRYFEKKKSGMVCTSVFLMVLTSFYFSIGAIVCLCLYALYCYLKYEQEKNRPFTVGGIVGAALKYVSRIFTGIFLSCFYLVPTAIALLRGRSSSGAAEKTDYLALFLPLGDADRLLYNEYGIGLVCLALIAVLAGMFQKKAAGKVLSIGLFLITAFPVFSYALNGFLYNRSKVLIPFLPVICLQTGLWLSGLKEKKGKRGILPAFLLLFLYFAMIWNDIKGSDEAVIYLVDFALVLLSVLLYCRWKPDIRIIIIPAIFVLVFVNRMNWKDFHETLKWSDLELENREQIAEMVESAAEMDHTLYRMEYYGDKNENFKNMNRIFGIDQNITSLYSSTYNAPYSYFRNTVFDVEKNYRNTLMESLSENVVFRKLMGVKYILSDTKPVGYEEVETAEDEGMGVSETGNEKDDSLRLYRDENTAPIAYGTSKIVDAGAYEQLKFPYNQLGLLCFAAAGETTDSDKETDDNEKTENGAETGCIPDMISGVEYDLENYVKELDVSDVLEGLFHAAYGDEEETVKLNIPVLDQEQILFFRFHVENTGKKDVLIKAGTAYNNLTAASHIYYNNNRVFSYAVGIEAGQKDVDLIFEKGSCRITDAEAYLVSVNNLEQMQKELYEYKFTEDTDKKDTDEKDADEKDTDEKDIDKETVDEESSGAENIGAKNSVFSRKSRSGNVLSGSINMKEDGYLITSIPYDENFKILVDGEKKSVEMVNEGFCGIKLEKGSHEISFSYRSPGKILGDVLTVLGIAMLAGILFKSRKYCSTFRPGEQGNCGNSSDFS